MAVDLSSSSAPRFMVHVTLTVQPEDMPILLENLRILFESVYKEPECQFVEVILNTDNPGVVVIQEAWQADREWLMKVFESSIYDL